MPEHPQLHPTLQLGRILEQKTQSQFPEQRKDDLIQYMNFWDKSYYGYNRQETE